MYWRAEKSLVEFTVNTFRRIFKYAPEWFNKDLEIVQLPSGSTDGNLIFEQYAEAGEKYPRVMVSGVGGTYNQMAFNDLIDTYDNDACTLGSRTLQEVYISGNNIIAAPLPQAVVGQTMRGIFTTLRWTGLDFGTDDLNILIYKNYKTSPVLVGSAIIDSNNISDTIKEIYSELNNLVNITDASYYIVYQVATGSSYYIEADSTYNGIYMSNGIQQSGSVVGRLLLPGFVRIGGFFDGSLLIKCEAKNDAASPRDLAELIAQYFNYLKHAQVKRGSVPDTMVYTDGDTDISSEWLSKGIMIKQVREGPIGMRPRDTNDKIFGVTLTVDYYTEWFEDFPLSALEDITLTINNFWEKITASFTQ